MTVPKKYFQDKLVLLLLIVSVFLVVLGSVLILLRLGGGHAQDYFVQYRSNLGIRAFKTGGVSTLLIFIAFLVWVTVLHVGLSMRVYHVRRPLAVIILAMGVILQLMAVIVSNALLVVR